MLFFHKIEPPMQDNTQKQDIKVQKQVFNVLVPDAVLKEFKKRCIEDGVTIQGGTKDALRLYAERERESEAA